MIQVAGRPFDAEKMASEYPLQSVERIVLETMAHSEAVYRFGSVGELRFSLSLRKEIVEASKKQSRSGLRFSTYWQRTENGGFQLKKEAVPSEAIEDIFRNGRLYATECATAMVIIMYGALLAVYGADLFNRTFKNIYLMDWSIRQPLLQEIGTPKTVPELLIGDRAYFMNEDVSPETPWWRGENVIVLPNDLYYGHGVGIRTAPEIIASLNRNRKKDAQRSAYLMDKAARPNFQKLFKVWQDDQNRNGPLVWRLPETTPVAQPMRRSY